MKCPECIKQGLRSTVHAGNCGRTTLVYYPSWYDEDGEYHLHDMNTTTWDYSCSNGHRWTKTTQGKCPNPKCDWRK